MDYCFNAFQAHIYPRVVASLANSSDVNGVMDDCSAAFPHGICVNQIVHTICQTVIQAAAQPTLREGVISEPETVNHESSFHRRVSASTVLQTHQASDLSK